MVKIGVIEYTVGNISFIFGVGIEFKFQLKQREDLVFIGHYRIIGYDGNNAKLSMLIDKHFVPNDSGITVDWLYKTLDNGELWLV